MSSVGQGIIISASYSTRCFLLCLQSPTTLTYPDCLKNMESVADRVSPFRHSQALCLECTTRVWGTRRQRNSCQKAKDHHRHCPLLFHLLVCLCDLSFLRAACTSLHIQNTTKMQTIPFPCQNPPLNTHFCLEGEDKRMNHR